VFVIWVPFVAVKLPPTVTASPSAARTALARATAEAARGSQAAKRPCQQGAA
jgi:hypothetical protein